MIDRERGHGSLSAERGHGSLSAERGHGSLSEERGHGSLSEERGQSLVEMALLLPVLLLVLHGTIDFARVFYARVTVNNAVRVAARYGSWNPQYESDIVDRAVDEASRLLELDRGRVVVTCDNGSCGLASDQITVTAEYDFQTLFFGNLAFVRDFIAPDGVVTVRGSATVPITLAVHG